MHPAYATYTALTSGLFLTCFPAFWVYSRFGGRHGKDLKERLGLIPSSFTSRLYGSPRLWLHAASLGEVNVAASIIRSLDRMIPKASVVVSTITKHGHEAANRILGNKIPVIYAPIDTLFTAKQALRRLRPDVMVFLETEIWPSWLHEATRSGAKTALVNGRISVRSIGRYLRFRPLFEDCLKKFESFSMISEEDARRIISLGADPSRVKVNGNAKYDIHVHRIDPHAETEMRRILDLNAATPVFIAGSTRKGEEPLIVKAYCDIRKSIPGTVLILAPRHLRRLPEIRELIEKKGLGHHRWTDLVSGREKRSRPVILIDTFGDLFKIYSVGTVVFCGGSLVPLGGQNPLEPASWGKVVLFGPSMDDFREARELLESLGAGISVSDYSGLTQEFIRLLRRPDLLASLGTKAKKAVIEHRGAAERHAEVIYKLVEKVTRDP